MNGGCMSELVRMVVRGFVRLGEWIAALIFRTLAFLLVGVVGPLLLGMLREAARRVLGQEREDEQAAPRGVVGYILLSGIVFVVGFLFLWLIWALVSGGSGLLLARLLPTGPGFLQPVVVLVLIFLVGALAGAIAHRHDDQFFAGW